MQLLEEKARRQRMRRIDNYSPSAKQLLFHEAGATHRERLFMAGNQLGKTLAGGAEVAFHLTGKYPAWWKGARFTRPVRWWAASQTGEVTRDNPQRILLGDTLEAIGTGMIPGDLIVRWRRHPQVVDGVARVSIRHVSGGESLLTFKNYEQGRAKWQGPTLDGIWYDEEPPYSVYTEGLTRTNKGQLGQFTMITFTPLEGMTETVMRFLSDEPGVRSPSSHVTRMGIREADHYTDEEKERIIMSYPAHEREARANGAPILGSGRVFTVADDDVQVEPFAVPKHWRKIIGIDLGGGDSTGAHPSAAVKLAIDDSAGIVYVVETWRRKGVTIADHASAIRKMGGSTIPVAWPHDTLQTNRGSGKKWVEEYMEEGLAMLPMHAQFAQQMDGSPGGYGLEDGVMIMSSMFAKGTLKIFRGNDALMQEYSMYHRKDGKIVKLQDDALSALRYALMMERFADREAPLPNQYRPQTMADYGKRKNPSEDDSWVV